MTAYEDGWKEGYRAASSVIEPSSKNDWVKDIHDMHKKYGVHEWVEANKHDVDKMQKFMQFRLCFLQEELDETQDAFMQGDTEEIVDGLIDLCVIAIGTLDAYGCDAHGAWREVLRANLSKQVGIKESRPNPLGLPDLVKPEGWKGPDHEGKTGILNDVFADERELKW